VARKIAIFFRFKRKNRQINKTKTIIPPGGKNNCMTILRNISGKTTIFDTEIFP